MSLPPPKPPKPSLDHLREKEAKSGLQSCLVAQDAVRKKRDAEVVVIKGDDELEKHRRMRGAVITEIITTEQAYVDDLHIIVDCFLFPLRDSQVASMEELGHLFSNLELVAEANEEILTELLSARIKCIHISELCIGQLFNKRIEYLVQVYTHYCLNQVTATTTFVSLMKRSKFRSVLEKLQTQPQCRRLDLMSFIVKPVQRLCKYPLLLRELLKYTSEQHEDFEAVRSALEHVSGLVALVNQSSREASNVQQIVDVEQRLVNAKHLKLVIPGRRFVMDGRFKKISGSNVQERHFFLFNDMLLYAKPHLVKARMFDLKGVIPLKLASIKDLDDTESLKNAIEIWRIDLKKKYIMYAEDLETKKEWFRALETHIEEASKASSETKEADPLEESEDAVDSSVAFQMEADDAKGAQSLKMAQLESRIVGFKTFAKPGRKFLNEGPVLWSGKTSQVSELKSRHFFMFNDILLVAKRHGDSAKKSFHIKELIPLDAVLVQDLKDVQASVMSSEWMHTFEIVRMDTKTKSLVKCPNEHVKEEWVKALSHAMESGVLKAEVETSISYDNVTRHSKRSSSTGSRDSVGRTRPLDRKQSSDVKSCDICSAAFGISRLRKRCGMCDAVCCGSCTKKKQKQGQMVRLCAKCFLK